MAHIQMTPVVVFLLLATLTGHTVLAIRCYHCTITPPGLGTNETSRLCVDFDYSEKYIVECQYSTMCMKKSFTFSLLDGVQVLGVLRNCAAQKKDHQVYVNGKWHKETDIEEAYEEGCSLQDDKGARTLPTEYCYCRRHLCNSAKSNERSELSYHTDAMAVIFAFNAIKYFRSME